LFTEFPVHCMQYRGPHSLVCYTFLWEDVGCLREGWHDPGNVTQRQNATLQALNLM